ncbi:MAG: hypothetical protein NW200_03885 [Hyphomonadaceae bacterium]|nr:hypothetical protein [Hyphomonadaceae bacterium]
MTPRPTPTDEAFSRIVTADLAACLAAAYALRNATGGRLPLLAQAFLETDRSKLDDLDRRQVAELCAVLDTGAAFLAAAAAYESGACSCPDCRAKGRSAHGPSQPGGSAP